MDDAYANEELISSPQGDHDLLRYVGPETPCPYLPQRLSRNEAFVVDQLAGPTYEGLLGQGFRRSGRVIYRPRCRTCRGCRAIRIPVQQFTRSRSMRRVWRLNEDLRVEVGDPTPTPEKFEMFCRYLDRQHDGTMDRSYSSFEEFLYDSPLATREFRYFLGDRLVGVSLVDEWPAALSSVYMYFDPECAARSLGTYSVLWEVEYGRRKEKNYYYLGFFVAGSDKMAYKSRFRPNEILVADHRWVKFRE